MRSWGDVRTRHRDELREHVRRAAVELVLECGIAGASMSQLAQRSGVPRATVYTYYRSVEHAVADWLDAEVGAFRAELATVLAGLDDPVDRLGAYLVAQCRVFAGDGLGLGGAGAAAAGPPGPVLGTALARHIDGFRALVRDLLDDAVVHGALRAGLDTSLHAALIVALVDGARPAVAEGRLGPDVAAAEILALLRGGIGLTGGRG